MGLSITNQESIYLLSGKLTYDNAPEFLNYFEGIIPESEEITINIEELSAIDKAGVNALVKAYSKSLEFNTRFFIIGFGSKEMHEHLRAVNSAA